MESLDHFQSMNLFCYPALNLSIFCGFCCCLLKQQWVMFDPVFFSGNDFLLSICFVSLSPLLSINSLFYNENKRPFERVSLGISSLFGSPSSSFCFNRFVKLFFRLNFRIFFMYSLPCQDCFYLLFI